MKHLPVVVMIIMYCSACINLLLAKPAEHGWYYDQSVGSSYNPLGMQIDSQIYYRYPLQLGSGILWESAKIDIGIENCLTPTDDRFFAVLKIEPIAVFDLKIRSGYFGLYKSAGYGFVSLQSYSSGFSESDIANAHHENKSGLWIDAAPEFKIRKEQFIFTHTFTVSYIKIVNNHQEYYYEPHQNLILKNTDYTLLNSTNLLYQIHAKIIAGFNHQITNVPRSGYKSEIISAVEIYTHTFSSGTDLFVALQEGVYLKDRYYKHNVYCAGQAGFSLKI